MSDLLKQDIINFGKYNGKNIIHLLKDRDYSRWFISQQDLCNKYTYIYNKIKDYNPLTYFLKSPITIPPLPKASEFLEKYPYFNLKSIKEVQENNEIELTYSDIKAYEFYLQSIEQIKAKINYNMIGAVNDTDKEAAFNIKAPTNLMKTFETKTEINREEFKNFLSSNDLPPITTIIEDVKKVAGIEYKGNKTYKIARENSQKQEAYWEGILRAKYGDDIAAQYNFERRDEDGNTLGKCLFDFINLPCKILYECKLHIKDFNDKQFEKYKLTVGSSFKILYLIDRDCIIDIDNCLLKTTNVNKYIGVKMSLLKKKQLTEFEDNIVSFGINGYITLEECL